MSLSRAVSRAGASAVLNGRDRERTEAAARELTKAMGAELGVSGVRVNGLAPGYFRRKFNEALTKDPAFSDWLVGRTPLGRWGKNGRTDRRGDLSRLRRFELRHGQIIYVDGGITSAI